MNDLDRYLTPEVIEKAAKALHADNCIDDNCDHCVNEWERDTETVLFDVVPDIIRRAKAEGWDEGYIAGHEDARAVQPTYPQPTLNPYADTVKESEPHCPDCTDPA